MQEQIEFEISKKGEEKTSLQDVYDVYNKWMVFDSTDRIDLLLAHRLTVLLEGKPVWLIVIGPSGDGKSEQAMTFLDGDGTCVIHEMTDKTLVSGKGGGIDLAPKLNGKYVIFPDLSQLLKERSDIKAKVWAQLRELFDGRAGRSTGNREDPDYSGIKTTFLMCATPSIDAQILIFNDLGTRELLWRTDEKQYGKIMDKVWDDECKSECKAKELKEVTQNFISSHKISEKEIPQHVKERIQTLVTYMRYMRATAEIDSYTNELRNFAYPESPARVIQSLKKMYVALMSLDEDYSEEKAMRIITKLVIDSINQIRHMIVRKLRRYGVMNTSQIANEITMGKRTAERELNVLWNLGILLKTEVQETNMYGKKYVVETSWEFRKDHEFFKAVKELMGEF